MKSLEVRLREIRDSGRKALVPYFMAGLSEDWTDHVAGAIHAGADAVEIGIPFSDPMMDGVVIQEAALRALGSGVTFDSACDDLARLATEVPLIAMTYFNIFHHYGIERSAGRLHSSGLSGVIVPDLSLEESPEWVASCDANDVATIFLVAPSSTPERLKLIAQSTQGFAYASARMAVTGSSSGDGEGARIVKAIREVSTVPTYIGIGITTPEQARAASGVSDGVIVGSALVQVLLDGGSASDVERFIGDFRRAID
ncbi:MAG: tryptophan synthase subunit alpha [Acidimicrobiaceae bacterium]|nr:tryptophan synthase subunit alpha [Acidimicrobiaceae bacterium]